MRRHLVIAAILVTGVLAAACAKATQPAAEGSPPPVGHVHVTQSIQGPLYIEGSVGYVQVTDGSGVVFEGKVPQGGLTRDLPAGTYSLHSYQRICGGNCDHLGPPADRCQASLTVAANRSVDAVVKLTPTKNSCSISVG
jgi:hypothetical protein